jgi:hypothetical protein
MCPEWELVKHRMMQRASLSHLFGFAQEQLRTLQQMTGDIVFHPPLSL